MTFFDKILRLLVRVQMRTKNEANCHEANTNLACSKFRSKQLVRFNELIFGK